MALVNRILTGEKRQKVLGEVKEYPSIVVGDDMIMDAELIATGGYTPLEGFLGSQDLQSVLQNMRLTNGTPWSIPIVLPVDEKTAGKVKGASAVAILDSSNTPIGVLHLEELYTYDKHLMAEKVFRTTDAKHPGVAKVNGWGEFLLGGKFDLVNRPKHPFERYHMDPAQTREAFESMGWKTIVGFQTRNPIHRSHEYLQKCALEMVDGLLIHPIVGWTREEDVPAELRIKSYEIMLNKYYPRNRVLFSTLATSMRYAGPKEAIFHALVRRNFGCTHFIVGRDHAGVGDYYGPYDAHRIFGEFDDGELGVTPLFFDNAFFCIQCDAMATEKTCPHLKSTRVSLSGTKIRELLSDGKKISEKVLRPEIAELLRDYYQKGTK